MKMSYLKNILGNGKLVILEMGAHKGEDTFLMLKAFPEANLYCFEPDPRNVIVFKKFIKNKRCSLFEVAVSKSDGKELLHLSSGYSKKKPGVLHTGSSTIKDPTLFQTLYPWLKFDDKLMVKSICLDSWFNGRGIDKIDFIWMDVQGAEGDVILGASAVLKCTKYLYMEAMDKAQSKDSLSYSELLGLLPDFEVVRRYTYDVLLRNKFLT